MPHLRQLVPLLLLAALPAPAQQPATETTPTPTATSEVPRVPGFSSLLRGFNAGVSLIGLHDSQNGYATLLQPALGYSFNDIFSLDATIPIYLYRLAASIGGNGQLSPQRGEPGDLLFGLHAEFLPRHFQYQATVSATAPTGDSTHGLSTGRFTVDLSNHFQHTFHRVTPDIEIGIGNSSSLANQELNRNYTSLGPLAHFQAGLAFPLLRGMSFSADAYEQLPLGDQKLYETIGDPRGMRPTITVVTGRSVAEDNGFTNTLDIPLNGHLTAAGYYNRSLRFKDDTVSFGLTYVFRSSRAAQKAADEDLLRAVEQELAKPNPRP